jgi:D-amino peptidase
MVQGITRDDDLAVFVGYHAAAGADGVLAHTFSSNFTELRVNGAPMTEAEVNALYAASHGVPVAVVTGDDQICTVAAKAFAGVATAEVKKATGWSATDSLHPLAARELIERTVAGAVTGAGELRPSPLPDQLVLEVDCSSLLGADFAASVPRSVRMSPRTLRYEAADVEELLHAIMSFYYLVALAAQQTSAIAFRR